MAENSSEKVESKTPNEIEELRKRRLAYFESTSTQSLQSQNEKDTAQSKQLQSMTKDELQNIFDTDKEKKLNNNEYGDKHRLNNFKSAEGQNYGYSKYSDNVDTGYTEYSKDEKDEFRLITEKLQHKMSQGGGDGCDEEVENLIRLAKREIAERYGNKNETTHGSSRIDAKGDNFQLSNHTHKESTLPLQSGDAYTQPIREKTATCDMSDLTQKRLNDSKISEKSHLQSHVQKSESKNPVLYRETIKPKKVEERNIEDLFSDRHPYSHNRQPDVHSSFKLRASDSHDFDSMAAFQKSVDTEVIDDLGLSTHRAESERLDSNVSDVHFEKEIQNVEEKLKQVSPRVFNEVTSDELRFALGAKKYKEFLEKSLRDIDELHSDRSTDRRASSKELSKSKAYRGHKTAEKDKDLKLLKSEKQKSKEVPSSAEVKTKTNKNTNVEEKANIHHEIESEFTKVTESLDNVSGIKFDKGETTHVDTDMDNNFGRPLLNRPKHEPKNIYAPKQQMSEKDKDTPNRNYEQLTVARNVVFSADEIYNQAYKGHVPVTPDHFSSVPSSPHIQGQGHMMNPLYHSVNMGYGQQYIQQPPNPFVHNSPSVYGPGQFNHPQYHAYAHHHPTGPVDMGPPIPPQGPYQVPGEMERYVQQMSARSLQSFDGSEFQKYPQYYSPVIPHPPESKPSSSEMKSRPVQNVHMKNLHQFPHKEPHPPGSVPHSARTSQPSEFTNYLQQMPKGIPYPPPPENVDLSAYFQYLSTQGYPMPYPRMMPTYPPGQAYVQMTPPYNRMDSAEMFVDDKTKVLETNGQIMIPHPPAQKRDESSPRRNSRLDITNVHDGKGDLKQDVPVGEHDGWRDNKDKLIVDQDSKNPSQRHIEGIRQFHEQRRLQQEEDEVLQKQRKFAKASIDRYFTSLENLYRRDHNQNLNEETEASTPHKETTPIKPPVDNDGEETLVNTEFTSATSIKAGGVTEREEKLGIDLSFIKGEGQKASKENMDNSSKSNGKLVIVCPECGEVNKPYMSWCADCGDVLIGVNPILMKKGKNGKLKRCITENQNVEIENIKNVTFVEKEIEGDPGIVPQIVSERDGEISPVHDEVYKGKASPNKSDSRDSGRPSSEDMDYCRTEKEVTEICENISDPVIKGFIKAYFNRKKQAINMKDGKDTSTGDEEENDGEDNTHAGQSNDLEAFASQIDVQNQENSHTTQNFDQTQSCPSVQNYVQVLSNSSAPDFVQANSNSHQSTQELQTQNQCDLNAVEPPVLSKTKPSYSKKKSKLKKNVPVDIEVFPSSERRSSGRSEPIVPILNLVNSSDEENEINEQRNRQLLDSSTDTNDLNEFFDPPEESIEMVADSQEGVDNEEQQPFLAQVMAEINTTPKPKRPSSGNGRGKRPGNNNARSIVRESIESAGYQRHWERSSIAWGSYNQRELSTKSSIRGQPSRGRPSSASRNRFVRGSNDNLQEDISGTSSERKPVPKKKQLNNRPASADTRRPRAAVNPPKSNRRSSDSVNAYESVDVTNTDSPKLQVNSPSEVDTVPDIPGIVHHRLPVEQVEDVQTKNISTSSTVVPMTSNERNFMKFQEMTPRIRDGELSMWLCFPDEIFLHILSYLSQSDLAKCAQVCKTFYRLVMDLSLWKYITVKKKRNLDDESLVMIGKRHPVSLALIQCHGENITARGLRELFRECSEYLRELNFSGCSRGALTGDCILLHASARCRNITHVDASWCNVTDSGIGAISESCNRLESLCINGCQMISDEGLETVIKKHGKSLRILEMFGCFNITPKGIRYLGNHCINLITLNLGQCYKMTDSCITQLSNSLGKVETLDLRGCKNIKDNCMRYVVKNCPRLKTIVLANCPNISDVSVLEISTYTTDIRNIDVCGCRKITDSGIRALANNCQNLRYIDISSSGCSHRSVSMLANFCSQRLETVKLNFLSDVTETVLIKLAKHCKRLKLLHLYGCTSVRLTDKIREANPNLVVEM